MTAQLFIKHDSDGNEVGEVRGTVGPLPPASWQGLLQAFGAPVQAQPAPEPAGAAFEPFFRLIAAWNEPMGRWEFCVCDRTSPDAIDWKLTMSSVAMDPPTAEAIAPVVSGLVQAMHRSAAARAAAKAATA